MDTIIKKRTCTKCEILKNLNDFYKNGKYSDDSIKYRFVCKICYIKNKMSNIETKEQRKIYNKKYYMKNKNKKLI